MHFAKKITTGYEGRKTMHWQRVFSRYGLGVQSTVLQRKEKRWSNLAKTGTWGLRRETGARKVLEDLFSYFLTKRGRGYRVNH